VFEGYRNGERVAVVKRGASAGVAIRVTPDTTELVEGDTYDVCRVVVEHVDPFGMVLLYSTEAVRVTVSGAGERIGPELIPLTGGAVAFWVKTKGTGEITVHVESPRYGIQERRLTVSRAR
jgi:beta-galactosidase